MTHELTQKTSWTEVKIESVCIWCDLQEIIYCKLLQFCSFWTQRSLLAVVAFNSYIFKYVCIRTYICVYVWNLRKYIFTYISLNSFGHKIMHSHVLTVIYFCWIYKIFFHFKSFNTTIRCCCFHFFTFDYTSTMCFTLCG